MRPHLIWWAWFCSPPFLLPPVLRERLTWIEERRQQSAGGSSWNHGELGSDFTCLVSCASSTDRRNTCVKFTRGSLRPKVFRARFPEIVFRSPTQIFPAIITGSI